jgi:hypothetical protein
MNCSGGETPEALHLEEPDTVCVVMPVMVFESDEQSFLIGDTDRNTEA